MENPPHRCVIVNITSRAFDDSCVLDVGDHPFIEHKSYVYYRKACIGEVSAIEQALRGNVVQRDQDMQPATLRRIQEAALRSTGTPNEVKDFLKEYANL